MLKIILLSSFQKEGQIIKAAFQQKGFQVALYQPNPANYLQCLQFMPHIIFVEMPSKHIDQISAIQLIKKNRKLTNIPIITYGNHSDPKVIERFKIAGSDTFHPRPIKIGVFFKEVDERLKDLKMAPSKKKKDVDTIDWKYVEDPKKTISDKINYMCEYIGKLLSFPFTVAKIATISEDSSSGARDLSKAIQADGPTTATLLKVANSVVFASRNRKISDLKEAIVRIGFNETKNIALSMSILKIVEKSRESQMDRVDFWYNSLATAIISEKLARRSQLIQPGVAYLGGLLHDFGLLMIDEFFAPICEKIIQKSLDEKTTITEAEKSLMGFTHHDLSHQLFQGWQLPPELAISLKHHLNFVKLSREKPNQAINLPLIAGMARILAKSAGIGVSGDCYIHPIPNEVMNRFKFTSAPNEDFFGNVTQEIRVFGKFLDLEQRDYPELKAGKNGTEKESIGMLNLGGDIMEPILIYLNQRGFELEMYNGIGAMKENGNSHRAWIVNTSASVDPQVLKGVMENLEKPGPNTPLVLVVLDDAVPAPVKPGAIKVLSKTLDLRFLDMLLESTDQSTEVAVTA